MPLASLTAAQQVHMTESDWSEVKAITRDLAGLELDRIDLNSQGKEIDKRWQRLLGRLRQRKRRAEKETS